MSASQASALTAIVLQLTATLAKYEADLARLVPSRFDPDLYQQVSRHVDDMRMYSAALPQVSVAWVELLIRHFELTHAIWRLGQGKSTAEEIDGLRAAQCESIGELRRKCEQVLETNS